MHGGIGWNQNAHTFPHMPVINKRECAKNYLQFKKVGMCFEFNYTLSNDDRYLLA